MSQRDLVELFGTSEELNEILEYKDIFNGDEDSPEYMLKEMLAQICSEEEVILRMSDMTTFAKLLNTLIHKCDSLRMVHDIDDVGFLSALQTPAAMSTLVDIYMYRGYEQLDYGSKMSLIACSDWDSDSLTHDEMVQARRAFIFDCIFEDTRSPELIEQIIEFESNYDLVLAAIFQLAEKFPQEKYEILSREEARKIMKGSDFDKYVKDDAESEDTYNDLEDD